MLFNIIPPAVLSAFGLLAFFLGRYYAAKKLKEIEFVTHIPTVRAGRVAYEAPNAAKLAGEVVPAGGTWSPPSRARRWSTSTCSSRRSRRAGSRSRTARATPAGCRRRPGCPGCPTSAWCRSAWRTTRGRVEVSVAEAEVQLRSLEKAAPGFFTSPPKAVRQYVEREHGLESGWLDNPLRYTEKVIEPGDKMLVIGKVKLIKTSRGVRPRFVKGQRGMVLTDRTEAQHLAWLHRTLWYSRISMIAGPLLVLVPWGISLLMLFGGK
ncbi:MAG: hypothetical protein K2W96_15990 [Gemmataceae bacterium]|nr:hypothetical protein [Gemmataceae bacterium]